MEKFKDADGRAWKIAPNWKQFRAMKERGFTLEAMSPDENGETRLDTVVAIDALLICTEAERKAEKVSDDDFAGSIVNCIGPAMEALVRETCRFFRLPIPDELRQEKSSPETANSSTA